MIKLNLLNLVFLRLGLRCPMLVECFHSNNVSQNIWRNCHDEFTTCKRKPDYPHQGQGLRHMACRLRWTREEPPLRGYHEWEGFRNAQDPNDVVILQDVVDVAK